jgi:hypothetical protein
MNFCHIIFVGKMFNKVLYFCINSNIRFVLFFERNTLALFLRAFFIYSYFNIALYVYIYINLYLIFDEYISLNNFLLLTFI